MKKRVLAFLLVLAMAFTLTAPCYAAASLRVSGSLSMPKLSKQEIAQLLADNPNTLPVKDIYDVLPSCSAPYAPGKVKDVVLAATADRLNALRRLGGVPAVALDQDLCEIAQYGAVLLTASSFSHQPSQPADMDAAFYAKALKATSSSNIYSGGDLPSRPDGYMDDSDASNISRLGHRRWQLNPTMGKVGFGTASRTGNSGGPSTEYVFDTSGAGCDYDFIGWPASGNFPADLFGRHVAWSVVVNPQRYQTPDQSKLTVTMTRRSDGRTWTFSNSSGAEGSGTYFRVDTVGYGVPNCIIFRPDEVTNYAGVYTVRIDGLKSKSGQAVTDFVYEVEFFDLDKATEPAVPSAGKTAIPTNDSLTVDGKPAAPTAYKIDGANYFKLRDVAMLVDGTPGQFNVNYNETEKTIRIFTGMPYWPVGGELGGTPTKSETATPTNNPLYINGEKVDLPVYKIGGANYFKLRDLCRALGFNAGWDAERGMFIESGKPYTDAD